MNVNKHERIDMFWMLLQPYQEPHHARRQGPIRLFALQTQHPNNKNTEGLLYH